MKKINGVEVLGYEDFTRTLGNTSYPEYLAEKGVICKGCTYCIQNKSCSLEKAIEVCGKSVETLKAVPIDCVEYSLKCSLGFCTGEVKPPEGVYEYTYFPNECLKRLLNQENNFWDKGNYYVCKKCKCVYEIMNKSNGFVCPECESDNIFTFQDFLDNTIRVSIYFTPFTDRPFMQTEIIATATKKNNSIEIDFSANVYEDKEKCYIGTVNTTKVRFIRKDILDFGIKYLESIESELIKIISEYQEKNKPKVCYPILNRHPINELDLLEPEEIEPLPDCSKGSSNED